MTDAPTRAASRLDAALDELGAVAVAVSGGVDSITLATAAHRRLGGAATMFHAVSPAVPAAATDRVRALAAAQGWDLVVVDADEFADEDYLANPVDRCFYCKRDLYATIAAHTDARIVSGTNLDDLDDIRPGLVAAARADVSHPFVEAGIDKATVRTLARWFGLGELAELPAAPCLSSRVETGLAIDAAWLAVIDAVEVDLRDRLAPTAVRCRARADRISIELDADTLAGLGAAARQAIVADVSARWSAIGIELPVTIDRYRMGSAFLRVIS